jgi:sporulation protein YlmC with PRC-barrel domain
MRLTDLQDARIRTLDGKTLGRVHEVHADDGRIVAVTCGPGSLIERLTAKSNGRRIPWECVRKIGDGEIFVTEDPPQRKPAKKSLTSSRSRQGTRRSSGRPSKR